MKKMFGLLMGVLLPVSAFANPACPVCTVAIGASLEVARHIGVPDSVVGLWAGAMLALLGYWTIKFFDMRGWNWWGRNFMLMVLSVSTIGFAYLGTVKYNPVWICGMFRADPVLFGTLCGAAIFIVTEKLYDFMKVRNGGHAHFPFEKVVLPVIALALVSWVMVACL
ncbi:MAG TPA: hypothetical protein DD611_01835 [Alphaproteobacteria bacterium]|nr:hypothetical protein [Alphaproteobacteria bacterium]HBS76799.1 hypothetical protein [Alphaproteobacteria bacterium]